MHDHQTSSPAYQGGADAGRAGSRSERAAARRQVRERRHAVAAGVASNHGGVARLGDLLAAGLTREQIRAEVEAGVWSRPGCHTVFVAGGTPSQLARFWCALWESGSSSVLDGVSALQAAGLSGWSQGTVDVTVPNSLKPRQLAGVRHHRLRTVGEHVATGLRRTKPHVAAVRAALS